MKVLLLGANGQVGHEFAALGASRFDLVIPSRAEADLERPDAVAALVRREKPAVVVNAAAYTAVDNAEKDEARAHRINSESPAALAQAACEFGTLLVHYSTDYVFAGDASRPYREDDPVAPLGAYGRTKLAGERAIRESGCPHLILRTAWVYAPRGKNFVLTMLRLARERPELRVVADQVGSPTSARALANATIEVLDQPRSRAMKATYHATGAGQVSWQGFAQRIVQRGASLGLCKPVPVKSIATSDYPTPARRPAWSVLDNSKLAADFGVRLPAWETSLEECLQTIRSTAAA